MNASAKACGFALAAALLSAPSAEPSTPAHLQLIGPLQPPSAPALTGNWSAPADAVDAWEIADPELAGMFFSPGSRNAIPHAGVAGGNAVSYASVRRFVQEVDRIPRGSTVLYDPEPWKHTPIWEQTHPRSAMRRFVRVAREHGLRAVLAPSRTLAGPDPLCRSFLDCGYLEIEADAFQLQSQKLQCDLDAFRRLVRGARARSASPLIVQLTVIWPDPCVTPMVVRDAWAAAQPWAESYALWARPGDRQGLDALRLIAGQR